ncbi:tail fiber assembly protein [Escherichia coli]|uniref:tail fiber assembly protein n=1 Tax=Escherichia coli TaxID=562 RepID=UPI000944BA0C|nr:tail fiber assembly protein [Escherichia coli]EFK3241256.1 tail fiber assembly protein [Escherichia coli]
MQNLKSFKLVKPKTKLLKLSESDGQNILYLQSEDGMDWYECQSLYRDDTVKIMYDKENIIRSVVDRPVPERGNTYPAELTLDGSWKFVDGDVYQDEQIVNERIYKENSKKINELVREAQSAILNLQTAIEIDMSSDGDEEKLIEWRRYLCELNKITATDLSQSPLNTPLRPA